MAISNISEIQKNLLQKLESENKNFSFEWDEVRGILSFARSDTLASSQSHPSAETAPQESLLTKFIKEYGPLFGLDDGLRYMRLLRTKRDDIGWIHLVYQQFTAAKDQQHEKRPIEVYASKLAAHFNKDGNLIEVQSSCYPSFSIANEIKVSTPDLQKQVLKELINMEGFKSLQNGMRKRDEPLFPLMQQPHIVVYPWKGKHIYAWATYGYTKFTPSSKDENTTTKEIIAFGQMFFDAATGELFLFAPTRKGVETPTVGSGLSCTPLGGPFTNRSLNIVRIDTTNTYQLKNKTKARDIVTYDANANSSWVYPNIPSFIDSGTIPVSDDTDGDKNWNHTAANTTDAERTASQQPEVDEHFTCSDLYDWYAAIGGRVGWDDNQYSSPLVPNQAINAVSHTYDSGVGTSRSVNAFFDQELVSGHWVSHLAFFDGDPTGATNSSLVFDYLAGSRAVVGHEYQHAITDFSFIDGTGNPGLTYADWLTAVHEGMSDVFGGLFSGEWWMGTNISPTGQIFRNLAFPRDSTAADPSKFDHWDDRNNITGDGARYFRGDILAHSAYLIAQGGIHQRAARTPVLIPVHGIGRENASGLDVYKAARIYYRSMAHYLSNIGTVSGLPTNDENVFRTIRNGCISAAIDLYGINSVEHKTTVLGWYAVGLHPAGTVYGPDVTFITWGTDWWMSRPYIGITSPDWSSPDLFINNGGISEWNAKINVISGGSPTQYENKVYCRVRNIGDQTANNVQVQFEYTKITAGGANWLPMTDKDGNIQILNLGNLAAGQSNFSDIDQNTPPITAMVKWWIPPLDAGETVDHFCIRAHVSSINDINPHNNEVQSNIAYTPYVPGSFRAGFFIGNSYREAIPLDLRMDHTLPKEWTLRLLEPVQGVFLKSGEIRRVHALIDIPHVSDQNLQAPFNGRIVGSISGSHSGEFIGNLFRSALKGQTFTAQITLNTKMGDHVSGQFNGLLNLSTGKLNGSLTGVIQLKSGKHSEKTVLHVEGCLRPDRLINISQYYQGQPLGGISLQVQVPLPSGSCFQELPPADTFFIPEKSHGTPGTCQENAKSLIECLGFVSKEEVYSVKIRSVLVEVKFKQDDCS